MNSQRRSDAFAAGEDPPRIGDVAELAGVSVATVSRALRGLSNVSEATRDRVESAAAELGYHIDRNASRLATGRSETVAVVLPWVHSWYFSNVLGGIESVLGDTCDVLVTSVGDRSARHRLVSGRAPLWKRVDGLIIVDVLLAEDEIEHMVRSDVCAVTIGQRVSGFPSVTVDDFDSGRRATQHLLNLGHRRIGLIGTPVEGALPFLSETNRCAGFRHALAGAGLESVDELEVAGPISVDRGAEAMSELLEVAEPPTAVFAVADELAFGAHQMLLRLGYSLPADMSIVGFDDRDLSRMLDLSTIRQNPWSKGVAGAKLLLDFQQGVSEIEHVVSPSHLIARGSTGRLTAR